MRVQTKIVFMLFAIITVFMALLFFQKRFEGERLVSLFKQEEARTNSVFDKIVGLKSASLKMLAFDYTYWDEMVSFVETNDKKWASENIDTALPTYNANAIWIYKEDGTPVYFVSNIEDGFLKDLLSKIKIAKIFLQGHFAHFFLESPKGLFEIRGATIHPSNDVERKTPVRGYFFTGRLWSKDYILELSRLVDCSIVINPVSEKESPAYSNPEKGIISFNRFLDNWRGSPLVKVTVWKESEMISDFHYSYNKFFLMFIISVGIFLTALLFLLTRWIRRPLQLVSDALGKESSAVLDPLQDDRTEFGDIARIITGFFDQKEELLVEMERRQEAEEDLRKLNANLEDRIKERTNALEVANKELKAAYNELQETHNALIQSEKMAAVGLMASSIAHEIKNPIAIILQGAEYLEVHPSCKSLNEEIGMVRKAALRADKIIKDLLDYSRQTPLTFEELDCAPVIEESLSLVEHQLNLGNVKVAKDFTPGLPKVKIDSNQMKQVFINLFVNALDAMPQGGLITVAINKAQDKDGKYNLEITVTDTGCGIPEENLKKVFDPFFSTKKKSGSAGLGLAIIQRIIERHKGTIGIKSKVGVGTSFIINLLV